MIFLRKIARKIADLFKYKVDSIDSFVHIAKTSPAEKFITVRPFARVSDAFISQTVGLTGNWNYFVRCTLRIALRRTIIFERACPGTERFGSERGVADSESRSNSENTARQIARSTMELLGEELPQAFIELDDDILVES